MRMNDSPRQNSPSAIAVVRYGNAVRSVPSAARRKSDASLNRDLDVSYSSAGMVSCAKKASAGEEVGEEEGVAR